LIDSWKETECSGTLIASLRCIACAVERTGGDHLHQGTAQPGESSGSMT
jgi:hypothetical protein